MPDRPLAIDLETVRNTTRIVQLNWAGKVGEGYAGRWSPPVEEELRRWLEKGREIVLHNAAFDVSMLHQNGVRVENPIFDTMIAAAILEPDLPNNLEHVAKDYTDVLPWKHMSGEDLGVYGCIDADVTWRIREEAEKLLREEGVWGCFETSMGVLPLLLEMEWRGLKVDREAAGRERDKCRAEEMGAEQVLNDMVRTLPARGPEIGRRCEEVSALWTEIEEAATGRDRIAKRKRFREVVAELHELVLPNWNSQKQLLRVLDEMGLQRKTDHKRGKVTTDAAAIQELARQSGNPLLLELLRLRGKQKLRSTYYEKAAAGDGEIHPRYLLHRDYDIEGRQAGACSGRLASKPNIQNWPAEARSVVVPDEPGWELMEVDYKQIEFRVVAYKAGGRLWKLVNTPGFDIHKQVAGRYYNKSEEEIVKTERDIGKRVVYAGIYGVGALTLSRRSAADGIFISVADCKRFLKAFHALFPEVRKAQQQFVQEAQRTNKVTNAFGRFRRFFKPSEEVTEAYNFFPQSTAGDIILRAMRRLRGELPKPARIAIQVHDSLTFSYPKEMRKRIYECVKDIMEQAHPEMPGFTMPVDAKVGENWGSLRPWGSE